MIKIVVPVVVRYGREERMLVMQQLQSIIIKTFSTITSVNVDTLWEIIIMDKKVRHNKNLQFKVFFSGKDMIDLEDHLMSVPLCDYHKGMDFSLNPKYPKWLPKKEKWIYHETMHYRCKKCEKVYYNWRKSVDKLYRQLCKQYYPEDGTVFMGG